MFIDVSKEVPLPVVCAMMSILKNDIPSFIVHAKELETIQDEKARFRRLVECNAIHSAETICHSTIVQNAWKNNQNLTVHAWVYDLADG